MIENTEKVPKSGGVCFKLTMYLSTLLRLENQPNNNLRVLK